MSVKQQTWTIYRTNVNLPHVLDSQWMFIDLAKVINDHLTRWGQVRAMLTVVGFVMHVADIKRIHRSSFSVTDIPSFFVCCLRMIIDYNWFSKMLLDFNWTQIGTLSSKDVFLPWWTVFCLNATWMELRPSVVHMLSLSSLNIEQHNHLWWKGASFQAYLHSFTTPGRRNWRGA